MEDQIVLDKKFQKELNAGITSLILLSVLQQADEPMYGYQISKYFDSEEEHSPLVKQGVLYPVLRSLEKSALVSSQVEPSVSGPPRRYYRITALGQETLIRWVEMWKQTVSFVEDVLEGEYYD
jgi:PadR family transcriptional regulator PadR